MNLKTRLELLKKEIDGATSEDQRHGLYETLEVLLHLQANPPALRPDFKVVRVEVVDYDHANPGLARFLPDISRDEYYVVVPDHWNSTIVLKSTAEGFRIVMRMGSHELAGYMQGVPMLTREEAINAFNSVQ